MAALLAAEARPGHLHALEDVLVPDRRPDDRPAGRLHRLLQPAVREHGDDERSDRRVGRIGTGPGQPLQREHAEDLVAVDDGPAAVHRHEPVRVAVEGEAEIGAGLARRAPRAPPGRVAPRVGG